MEKYKAVPKILNLLSLIAVIIAGYVSVTKSDVFGLAGTQWILIGIVLAIYALTAKTTMQG